MFKLLFIKIKISSLKLLRVNSFEELSQNIPCSEMLKNLFGEYSPHIFVFSKYSFEKILLAVIAVYFLFKIS